MTAAPRPPDDNAPQVMAEVRVPLASIRGRGAATALAHRFVRDTREAVDDGWEGYVEDSDEPAPPATRVHLETAKSALCANDSPDIFFELSVNPYRGCEHVILQSPMCV